MSDIGAISPVRWQLTQERCRIGATSLVNVAWRSPDWAWPIVEVWISTTPTAAADNARTRDRSIILMRQILRPASGVVNCLLRRPGRWNLAPPDFRSGFLRGALATRSQ